jgi:hypothetical protein
VYARKANALCVLGCSLALVSFTVAYWIREADTGGLLSVALVFIGMLSILAGWSFRRTLIAFGAPFSRHQ